jgi:hypothetical protein
MKNVFLLLVGITLFAAACKESEEVTPVYNPSTDGLVGEWYSSKTNIAPLLVSFKIDSLYAKFNANNTYRVESFVAGAKTTLEGTYAQKKSDVGSIWTITLNQSTPTALTSEGIFEITKEASGKFLMKYEVVQTTPSISATPPTPTGGFGSTNGGKLGTINIQKYLKIEK